jgi:hypothetical protein
MGFGTLTRSDPPWDNTTLQFSKRSHPVNPEKASISDLLILISGKFQLSYTQNNGKGFTREELYSEGVLVTINDLLEKIVTMQRPGRRLNHNLETTILLTQIAPFILEHLSTTPTSKSEVSEMIILSRINEKFLIDFLKRFLESLNIYMAWANVDALDIEINIPKEM